MSSVNYKLLCCYATAEAWLNLPLGMLTKKSHLDAFYCAWDNSSAASAPF